MWNNKMKALTFSYDDGVTADKRLVEIFNKYGLKCTFNINTGMLSNFFSWEKNNRVISTRMTFQECKETYKGHEIACHTLTHPDLCKLPDEEVNCQVIGDKALIETLFSQKVNGMAYPYGTFDERVENVLKKADIKYSRTVIQSENFDISDNLLELKATCHHNNPKLFELAEEFISLNPDKPQLFYIWGHGYEYDNDDNWDRIEEFCKLISGKDDIYYCTNDEALSPFYK